jgi:hypothetical protein
MRRCKEERAALALFEPKRYRARDMITAKKQQPFELRCAVPLLIYLLKKQPCRFENGTDGALNFSG